MNSSIENFNIANDARSCDAVKIPTVTLHGCLNCGDSVQSCSCLHDFKPGEIEQILPWVWEMCGVCRGNGTHVNPAIDASGLSGDDTDDIDFMDNYRSGVYDVTCNACEGKRVVPVADEDAMTHEQRVALQAEQEAEAADNAERLAEIRMGC